MERITSDKTILYKFSGIFIIVLLYVMWGCNTIAYKNDSLLLGGVGTSLLALFLYCLAHDFVLFKLKDFRNDLLLLDVFLIFSGIVLSFGTFGTVINPSDHDKLCSRYVSEFGITIDLAATVMSVEALIWSIGILVLFCKAKKALKNEKHINCAFAHPVKRIKSIGCDNIQLIILLIIVCALCYDPNWRQFKWDGYLYYLWSDSLRITSLSNTAMYAHLSQFHSLIVLFFRYIWGDLALAMYLANIFMLLVAIVYFYMTIQMVTPGKSKILYLIATSIFAFSPFYLGMVTYYSLDYTMMCIFPIVVYYLIKEKWIPFIIAAFFFCFTKEPAIIIYGLLCVGTVITDLLGGKRKIKDIFRTVHYYYMLLPGVIFMATLAILGIWSGGESSVGFKADYTIDKLKTLYVLNFNWIFVIIIGLGIAAGLALAKDKLTDWKFVFLLMFVMLGFTLFSILFRTANHPRYSDAIPYCLYALSAVVILGIIDNKVLVYSILSVLSVVMLISSFWTIDPVSLKAFDTVNVGEAKIIKTSSVVGDGSIYNRQAFWMEKPYADAIKDSLKEGTKVVVLTYKNSIYDIDGMTEQLVVEGDYITSEHLWDEMREIRQPVKDVNTKFFDITFMGDSCDIEDVQNIGNEVSIIYPAYLDVNDYKGLYDLEKNESIQKYHYRGIDFYRMIVDSE